VGLSPTPLATFPQAPLRSRTAGFPRSGSDPGLSLRRLSSETRNATADSEHAPDSVVCDETRSPLRIGCSWLSVQGRSGTAKCPEFLRPTQALPAAERCHHLLDGLYPTVLATTHSCVSPVPSHRLRFMSRCAAGLCRLLSAPAGNGTFPTLSLRILPRMPGPLPRRSPRCTCSFLPVRLRPSLR
jgi:hypothetical protein